MKILQEQGKKQVETLKVLKQEENQQDLKSTEGLFPKEMRPTKLKDELDEISGWEEQITRINLKDETHKRIHDFQQLKVIRSFGENTTSGKIAISETDENQSNLLEIIVEFINKSRTGTKEGNMRKRNNFESVKAL